MVKPKETSAPVEFSGGGSNLMAKVRTSTGAWVSEMWPLGSLPTPTLRNDSATYADVLPGTDLTLTATAGGMSEVLVVKTPQAAANPALSDLQLAISGGSISSSPQALTAHATDGSQITAAKPVWWDSSQAGSSADGPGGDGGLRPLGHSTTSSTISLDVAAAADSTPTYPIFIDPDWSPGANAYWFTDLAYPNQSYLNGQYADGIQSVGNGGGYLSRAFWQFGTSPLNGKHVLGATFNATEVWSNTCTGKDIQAWHYGNATPGFTWNTDPGYWNSLQDTKNLSAGSSCSPASAVGFTVTGAVVWAVNNVIGTVQIGLRAANESDTLTRRHFSQAASLTVSYNTPPANPTSPQFTSPARSICTSGSPAYVNNGPSQPLTLQINQYDADGGNVNDGFYVYDASGSKLWYSVGTGSVAQGIEKVVVPANTLPSGDYKWEARAGDYIDLSAGYSPWCYFTVINTGPPVPTITLPTLQQGQSFTVGKAMTVTISANKSDHVAMFAVWWATGTSVTLPTTYAPGGAVPSCTTATAVPTVQYLCPTDPNNPSVQVTLAPPDTAATLEAASFDLAGNPTTTTPHAATKPVTAGSDTTGVSDSTGHRWLMDGLDIVNGTPNTVPDANTTASGLNLTVGATPSWANGTNGPSLSYPTSATATTSSAAVNTTQSFTVSAYLTPTNVAAGQTFTALSHGSGTDSDFTLGIANGHYQFCVRIPGSPTATAPDCAVGNAAAANLGNFVTGTYDAVNKMVSISFNGTAQSTASTTHIVPAGTTPSAGGLLVGADRTGSSTTQTWAGQIYDPSIYQGVASSGQLGYLYSGYDPNSGS